MPRDTVPASGLNRGSRIVLLVCMPVAKEWGVVGWGFIQESTQQVTHVGHKRGQEELYDAAQTGSQYAAGGADGKRAEVY